MSIKISYTCDGCGKDVTRAPLRYEFTLWRYETTGDQTGAPNQLSFYDGTTHACSDACLTKSFAAQRKKVDDLSDAAKRERDQADRAWSRSSRSNHGEGG